MRKEKLILGHVEMYESQISQKNQILDLIEWHYLEIYADNVSWVIEERRYCKHTALMKSKIRNYCLHCVVKMVFAHRYDFFIRKKFVCKLC